MLNNEQEEKLVQILLDRINALNEDILTIIGNRIKQIGELTPTQVHQIQQMLMYNTDINIIVQKLVEVTNMNVNDIYNMFEYSAKKNQDFARQFYKARGINYIPYSQNKALKEQIKAIAKITAKEYANISKTSAIGYTVKDLKGNLVFKDISSIYKDIIDKAILNVGQGKTTYQQEMRNAIKQIGQSGLKTLDYESGRSMRLDSAIRMNILGGLRKLNNQVQEQFGEEFDSDGVEISVHQYPADDHAEVQGHQFSNKEFEKLQETGIAKDYNGEIIDIHYKGNYRPISEYNCYHRPFRIVLGISKPLYTKEQLEEIKEKNNDGFDFDGKHYTMYQGTQLQRLIERRIREQKDIQILAKSSGDKELTLQAQTKITQLTTKYKQLCNVSGLSNQLKTRARVSEYKRINVSKTKSITYKTFEPRTIKDLSEIGEKYFNFESNDALDKYVNITGNIKDRLEKGDINLKTKLDSLEQDVSKLAKASPIDFQLFSAKDISQDYSKDKHLLSATVSREIAKGYINRKTNKEIITIYVDKGANIISTVNTKTKHFKKQGEIILPVKKKLKKLDNYTYILQK